MYKYTLLVYLYRLFRDGLVGEYKKKVLLLCGVYRSHTIIMSVSCMTEKGFTSFGENADTERLIESLVLTLQHCNNF